VLSVRLLGTFQISNDGSPVDLTSRPAQSLFAYLILHPGAAHRREKLAGMLWPDSLEETARDNLRHALWRIRKALPSPPVGYLHTDDLTIAFNASSEFWLDAQVVEEVSENASADELIAALSVYQGDLLPGFYDEWVVLEREHLQAVFEHKMARLLAVLQDQGRWLEVLDWAERWIKLGQKPEPAYRALMTAHAAKGDMSKVAATYERCLRALNEFGVGPSEQTRELYERLRAGRNSLGNETLFGVSEHQKRAAKTNLPVPITSFIGREREVEEIIKLLGAHRLLTLTGSGGVGKTRLAIESAKRLMDDFSDGVWWVELVGLNDPSLLSQEVAKAVGVREIPNRPMGEILLEQLQSKDTLLVLDNCEHLIGACAQLVDRLLSRCKNLKILTTSREALDILGETTWAAPALTLPSSEDNLSAKTLRTFESVRLFAERAEAIQPRFVLTDQNAGAALQICRRLGGMPLAIELAAARVKMMSPDDIAKRLDDRFSLLTSGNRTALPRHQTLRAAIDWSYELLTGAEQILFSRLSVFAGGFTLDAAEAICGFGELRSAEVLDLLGRLVDKSLVSAEITPVTATSRYRLLETIRQYAQGLLGEPGGVEGRNRHLQFIISLAEEAEDELELVNQVVWLDRLEIEIDNIRSAIDWAMASAQIILALRLVGALRRFWVIRGHDAEGLERIKAVLDRPEAQMPTPARLKTINAYSFILWPHGKLNEAQSLVDEAIELGARTGDRRQQAYALLWAGVSATEQGEYSRARLLLEQSREKGGDFARSADLAISLVFLAEIGMFEGNPDRAQQFFEAALSLFREVKDYPFAGMVVRRLGQLALKKGKLAEAVSLFQESLVYNWQIHDYRGVGACLAALGAANLEHGRHDRAARLFGVVDALLESIQVPLLPFDQHEYQRHLDKLHSQLGQASFDKAWARGHATRMEEVVESELKETHL
jgi:predicted ATPase/DNA-binding SARP family transcriptional activator